MKNGYHYTTVKNWKKIQKRGLVPYDVFKGHRTPGLDSEEDILGVWIWEEPLTRLENLAFLVRMYAQYLEHKLILLEVLYSEEDDLENVLDTKFRFAHGTDFSGGSIPIRAKSKIIAGKIPAENIIPIREWDLKELLAV